MSTDLYSINTELMEVQRLMGSYQMQMSSKREDLDRLQKALTDLEITSSDFYDAEDTCAKPEFTSKIFRGSHAKDVMSLRGDELRTSFISMPDEQVVKVKGRIREHIKLLQGQIGNLGSSISSLESQRSILQARKQEVKNQA